MISSNDNPQKNINDTKLIVLSAVSEAIDSKSHTVNMNLPSDIFANTLAAASNNETLQEKLPSTIILGSALSSNDRSTSIVENTYKLNKNNINFNDEKKSHLQISNPGLISDLVSYRDSAIALGDNSNATSTTYNIFLKSISESEKIKDVQNISRLVNYFQSRQASREIEKKLNDLKNLQGVVELAIIGIPGSGKTELAKNYALEEQKKNINENLIIWQFEAENEQKLLNSYRLFTTQLELAWHPESGETIEDTQKRIHKTLQLKIRKYRFILIFDNAKEHKTISPYLIDINGATGEILVTTQTPNFFTNTDECLSINRGMEEQEALELLSRLSGVSQDSYLDEAKSLVKKLDYLPLSISTAGLYIKAKNQNITTVKLYYSFANYLSDLEKRNEEAQKNSSKLREQHIYKNTQSNVLQLAIKNTDYYYRQLLFFCIWLDSQSLPEELLQYLYQIIIKIRKTNCMPKKNNISNQTQDFNELINSPISYGLLSQSTNHRDLFFIHRQTQQELLKFAKNNNRGFLAWQKRFLVILFEAFNKIYSVSRDDGNKLNRFGSVLFHVVKLVESMIESNDFELQSSAIILQRNLIWLYRYVGNHKEAYNISTNGVILCNKIFGNKKIRIERAIMLYEQAWCAADALEPLKALSNYNSAKEIFEKYYSKIKTSEVSLYIADCFNDIAIVYGELADDSYSAVNNEEYLDKAFENHWKAHKIYSSLSNNLSIAVSLNNIANLYRRLNNCQLAIEYCKNAIDIISLHDSNNYKDLGDIYDTLGHIYYDKAIKSQFDQDFTYSQNAFNTSTKYFSQWNPNHPNTAKHLLKVVDLYIQLRDYREALKICNEIVIIYTKAFGESFSKIISIQNKIESLKIAIKKTDKEYDKSTALNVNNENLNVDKNSAARLLTPLECQAYMQYKLEDRSNSIRSQSDMPSITQLISEEKKMSAHQTNHRYSFFYFCCSSNKRKNKNLNTQYMPHPLTRN